MNRIHVSYFFSLFMSLALLILPLPLSAMAEDILLGIPSHDQNILMHHADESYIYLGQDLSGIGQLISEIASLDDNNNSPIAELKSHIDSGCNVAQYDAIMQAIDYMQIVLHESYNKLNATQFKKIIRDIDILVDQIHKGELTVDAQALELAYKNQAINENILRGNRSYSNIMQVNGLLSVNDQIVQNITATSCSVTDTIIAQNSTITSLSITESIIGNITVSTSSVTDQVTQNLKTTNASITDATITGTLSATDAVVDTYLRFTDTAGGEYVGLQAPSTVTASYTATLPAMAPTAKQVLLAGSTPTNLTWATDGSFAVPANSQTIYVTKYGNDTTGDGSFATPYLTLTKGIEAANLIASATNPVAILMGSGTYTEDNSAGPLEITIAGVSIVGASANSVIIKPGTAANNLLLIDNTVRISDVTFQATTASATGISLAAGSLSIFSNVHINNFLIGVSCAGTAADSYGFNNCFFVNNGTALNVNDTRVEWNSCTIFGSSSLSGPAANIGINITGASANFVATGGVIGVCSTGMNITNNSTATANGLSLSLNEFDIVQNGSSHLTLSGCTIEITDTASDIDLQVSGAGTVAEIISCEFNGASLASVSQGIGIVVSDSGLVNITGGIMHNYTTGLQVGLSTDTISTVANASGLIIDHCTTDLLQQGASSLYFNSCTTSSSKITINNATNVEMAFFDLDDNGALTIGSTADQNTVLIQAAIAPSNHPGINYKSSLYSAQALGFENTYGSASSFYSLSANNSDLVSITTNRANVAGLRLVSDTGSPVAEQLRHYVVGILIKMQHQLNFHLPIKIVILLVSLQYLRTLLCSLMALITNCNYLQLVHKLFLIRIQTYTEAQQMFLKQMIV